MPVDFVQSSAGSLSLTRHLAWPTRSQMQKVWKSGPLHNGLISGLGILTLQSHGGHFSDHPVERNKRAFLADQGH